MYRKLGIAAATALVVLSAGAAFAQTTDSVDSVARGGVNLLDERIGALEGQPTLSGLVCSNGQVAKFNGAVWACAADNDTDTDTSAATVCGSGEVLTGDGTCASLASGSGQGRFQFAGDSGASGSTWTMDGSYGHHNMSQSCNAGIPGSRMCTTEEILATTFGNGQGALVDNVSGWVHPSIVGLNMLSGGTSADIVATDYSGLTGHPSSELSCDGWSSNSPDKTGLYATKGQAGGGNIVKGACSGFTQVACCKLFP